MVHHYARGWQICGGRPPREDRMAKLGPVLAQIETDFDASLARYIEFLRIPSISTDPACKDEVKRAGAWLEKEFRDLGFTAKLHDTPGHPILLAHREGASPDAPHLLYKGQVMTFLEAFRAWKAVHGALPAHVTVLIEGEEESGSESLPGFLTAHAASLSQAAAAIITDTNSWDIDTPAITYRLRGNVYVEVTLKGPSRDLHSGLYGGAVVNPVNALAETLGQLHGA